MGPRLTFSAVLSLRYSRIVPLANLWELEVIELSLRVSSEASMASDSWTREDMNMKTMRETTRIRLRRIIPMILRVFSDPLMMLIDKESI